MESGLFYFIRDIMAGYDPYIICRYKIFLIGNTDSKGISQLDIIRRLMSYTDIDLDAV